MVERGRLSGLIVLDPAHLPEGDGALGTGLWFEPRNWRKGGWGGVRWAVLHLLYIHGSSFLAWVPLPAEPVTVRKGSRKSRGGEHPMGGQLGSQVTSCAAGEKALGFQDQI